MKKEARYLWFVIFGKIQGVKGDGFVPSASAMAMAFGS